MCDTSNARSVSVLTLGGSFWEAENHSQLLWELRMAALKHSFGPRLMEGKIFHLPFGKSSAWHALQFRRPRSSERSKQVKAFLDVGIFAPFCQGSLRLRCLVLIPSKSPNTSPPSTWMGPLTRPSLQHEAAQESRFWVNFSVVLTWCTTRGGKFLW